MQYLITIFSFYKPKLVNPPLPVYLPDGNPQFVEHINPIPLHQNLLLEDELFLPSFKFYLTSVSKLCTSLGVRFNFYPSYCLKKGLRADFVIVVGKARTFTLC